MSQGARRGLIVVLVFGCMVGLSWLVSYFTSGLPKSQQACTQKCAEIKKEGNLVYRGPATPKDGYKAANSECECR